VRWWEKKLCGALCEWRALLLLLLLLMMMMMMMKLLCWPEEQELEWGRTSN